MKNKKGFTLLELLVAATIVGALAALATVSYRNSVAEARMQAGKSRTELLATAIQRYKLDHWQLPDTWDQILDLDPTKPDPGCTEPPFPENTNMAAVLLGCKYVKNGGWSDTYVHYFPCNGRSGSCNIPSETLPYEPLACMTGSNYSKVPNKYKNGYLYCVSERGAAEYIPAAS